jgi:MFS family permease
MTSTKHKLKSIKYVYLSQYNIVFCIITHRIGRKPVMTVGIIMLLISMGTRPFMPNLTLVTILEFFNGAGSIISYMAPFILGEYHEMKPIELMASVSYFCSKHFS